MIRVNIVFQFCGCMAVILLQGILAGLMLLTPVNKQDATLNNLGVFLGTLPILLGGILDYILAHNAYLIPWPPTIDVQVSRTFRGHEHSAWLTILKAAREAYKLVIAFVVLSLIGGLVIAVANVVLLIGVTAIIALLGLPMLWCEILEARHLFRTQTDRR